MPERFIGLMSGTSMEGVDGVLFEFDDLGQPTVLGHQAVALDVPLRTELLALNDSGADELHRSALAANSLVRIYGQVVNALLHQCRLEPSDIRAIGAHGQTVRHRPGQFDGTGYTLQLNNAALLAEVCRIDVVADFRSRDVAAGGQGAPLVPLFHQQVFGRPLETVAVLNIGGIANLSILRGDGTVLGFDCGPGNALLDLWCLLHTGKRFDTNGAWSQTGRVIDALLHRLLSEPYLQAPPPKSTGRDLFHSAWLDGHLKGFGTLAPQDVQATLTALTAQACAQDVLRHAPEVYEVLVCGGGALNRALMRQLSDALPGKDVITTQMRGMPPMQVEAAAFAWLARQTLLGRPGNLPAVTGANGQRVLGAIYPR